MGWWSSLKARHEDLIKEYGNAAIVTYLVIFFGTWVSFWAAMRAGFEVSSAGGAAGTIGGAYLATKLTQPVRIGATLVGTPIMVALWRRVRGDPPEPAAGPTPDSPTPTGTPSPE